MHGIRLAIKIMAISHRAIHCILVDVLSYTSPGMPFLHVKDPLLFFWTHKFQLKLTLLQCKIINDIKSVFQQSHMTSQLNEVNVLNYSKKEARSLILSIGHFTKKQKVLFDSFDSWIKSWPKLEMNFNNNGPLKIEMDPLNSVFQTFKRSKRPLFFRGGRTRLPKFNFSAKFPIG